MDLGRLFDEFYRPDLRNAISHADFILTDGGLRSRKGGRDGPFKMSFEELDDILTKAKVFIGTFFGLDEEARRIWGERASQGLQYDPHYKGLLEILIDADHLMCGFKIHWPNGTDSIYRRREAGVDMVNSMLDLNRKNIEFMVGLYARRPGPFSPLVEAGAQAVYTPLENGNPLAWGG